MTHVIDKFFNFAGYFFPRIFPGIFPRNFPGIFTRIFLGRKYWEFPRKINVSEKLSGI